MPNALANELNPPAPNPQPQGNNALAPQQQMASNPAPSHEQTVAALRHMQAIGEQLEGLLVNPELGRSDIRDSVIDAVTRLVAQRIISAPQAVAQLGQFPDRPFEQKQAIEQMYRQVMQAESSVLDHHGMTNPPQSEDFGTENSLYQSDPDQHMQTVQGMMQAHYGGQNG